MVVGFETFAAALLLALLACLLAGTVISALVEGRGNPWTGAPYALALLLVVSGVAAGQGAKGTTIGYLIVGVCAVALIVIVGWRRRRILGTGEPDSPEGTREPPPIDGHRKLLVPGIAGLVAALAACLPFIAAGQIGVLGVGLVNDDMAAHLLLADWIDARFLPEPILIAEGYPLGPHGLVAGLATLTDGTSVAAFSALTILIPALTAALVAARLDDRTDGVRILVAVPVAIAYLAAAYLAQGAFKEPMLALFILAVAFALPRPGQTLQPRNAVGLGMLVAGALYLYSFPALAWLLGTLAVWALLCLLRRASGGQPLSITSALPVIIAGLGTALVLALPELDRMVDFTNFKALDPDRANDGGLGNLSGGLSPFEAFGIWPTSDFRLPAGAGGIPAAAFYLGGLFGLAVLLIGSRRWARRYGTPVLAALLTVAVGYVGARLFGTVYTSAKALAIAAPVVMLAGLGGLLAGDPLRVESREDKRWSRFISPGRVAVITVFLLAAMGSSFLVLRQAVVGAPAHPAELAQIRPVVAGSDVLFLGRDNFVLWNLRGSRPYTHVRNYYNPYFVKPDTEVQQAGYKFDVDALKPEDLARFPFIITTRASFGSALPPEYRPVKVTDSYVLWGLVDPEDETAADSIAARQRGETGRSPATEDAPGLCTLVSGERVKNNQAAVATKADAAGGQASAAPGDPAVLDRNTRNAGAAVVADLPILIEADSWSSNTIENGQEATIRIDVPRGSWRVSLQYDSTRPLTITTPSFSTELPANLDYRGVSPMWSTGEGVLDMSEAGGIVEITASVAPPPRAGQLLGAKSLAHLGDVALTAVGPTYMGGVTAPFPGDGTTLVDQARPCHAVDWQG